MTTTTSSSAPAPDFNLGYDNFVAYLRDPETLGAAILPKRFSKHYTSICRLWPRRHMFIAARSSTPPLRAACNAFCTTLSG